MSETDELIAIQKYNKRQNIDKITEFYSALWEISRHDLFSSNFNLNQTKRHIIYDTLIKGDTEIHPKMIELFQYLNYQSNTPPFDYIDSIRFVYAKIPLDITPISRFQNETIDFKDPTYFDNVVRLIENTNERIYVPLHSQLKYIFILQKDPNRFWSNMEFFGRKLKCQEMILEGSKIAQKWVNHKKKVVEIVTHWYKLLKRCRSRINLMFLNFLKNPNWISKHMCEKYMSHRDTVARFCILLKMNVKKYRRGDKLINVENHYFGIDPHDLFGVYRFSGEKPRVEYRFESPDKEISSVFCKQVPIRILTEYLKDQTVNTSSNDEIISLWTEMLSKNEFNIPQSLYNKQFDTGDPNVDIASIFDWIDSMYGTSIEIFQNFVENEDEFDVLDLKPDHSNIQDVLDHFKIVLESQQHRFISYCLSNTYAHGLQKLQKNILEIRKSVQNEVRQRQLLINSLKEYSFPYQNILTLLSKLDPNQDFEYFAMLEYANIYKALTLEYSHVIQDISREGKN
jgi:hypothetical protein